MQYGKIIGTFGDVDSISYGSGVIIEDENGRIEFEVTIGCDNEHPGKEEDEDHPFNLTVWRGIIPPNVMEYYNWANWKGISDCCDIEMDEIVRLSTSEDVNERMSLINEIASYHGWEEFDQYPIMLSTTKLEERWNF